MRWADMFGGAGGGFGRFFIRHNDGVLHNEAFQETIVLAAEMGLTVAEFNCRSHYGMYGNLATSKLCNFRGGIFAPRSLTCNRQT